MSHPSLDRCGTAQHHWKGPCGTRGVGWRSGRRDKCCGRSPSGEAETQAQEERLERLAMVYYDDDGNVIEERLRNETPPDERPTICPLPEARPSRGACRREGGCFICCIGARNGLTGLDVENTAAMSNEVQVKRPRTSSSPQPDQPTRSCTSTRPLSFPYSHLSSPTLPLDNLHTPRSTPPPPAATVGGPVLFLPWPPKTSPLINDVPCASNPSHGAHSIMPASSPATRLPFTLSHTRTFRQRPCGITSTPTTRILGLYLHSSVSTFTPLVLALDHPLSLSDAPSPPPTFPPPPHPNFGLEFGRTAAAQPTGSQKADDIAQSKERRNTYPGSTAQPEACRANSTAPAQHRHS